MLEQIFHQKITSLLDEESSFGQILFAGDFYTPPAFSYQVNFPRLELVLAGTYHNQLETDDHHITEKILLPGDAVFVPPNCWNKPSWDTDCSVLSMLFGRRQLGLSMVHKRAGEESFYDIQKYSVQTSSGFAIDNILEALNALSRESPKKPMDKLLLKALLEYSCMLLKRPESETHNRVQDLYQGICIYIQENFHLNITRDSIAMRFNVSPNHLSRLFRQQGHMTLADYITWVRVDRAKFMLKKYNFKLAEVALRCGYKEVNYFCRVFKKKTGKTPSQYKISN